MANAIEQTVLLWYWQMEHKNGIKMANTIELMDLLWYGQMEHSSGG